MSPPMPSLVIADLPAGLDYLQRLPLSNPRLAEEQLARLFDALIAETPPLAVLFPLLEAARPAVAQVANEMGRAYQNRPLPLPLEEATTFARVVALRRKFGLVWAQCSRLPLPADDGVRRQLLATVLQRRLFCQGTLLGEYYRARQEIAPGLLGELNALYLAAERAGLAQQAVEDEVAGVESTHCAGTYVACLLIEQASPYSHSLRDYRLIRRWAALWGTLVDIAPIAGSPPKTLIVELGQDRALHPVERTRPPGDDARQFDLARLGARINEVLEQLAQRVTPSQLGLGEETPGHVKLLLERLLGIWTQAAGRRFRRFPTSGQAQVAQGFEAMHFCVTGKEFVQPQAASAYSRGDFDRLFTFRDQADPNMPLNIRPQTVFPVDDWEVVNQSADGFRLRRSALGLRVAHDSLIALHPHDGDTFLLAQVTWLMQQGDGGLVAGISVLPGVPEGVGVRYAADGQAHGDRFIRAFLLPPLAALAVEASLVVPTAFYQASRVLDVYSGGRFWQLRMKHVLQRGSDYDRVSYQVL